MKATTLRMSIIAIIAGAILGLATMAVAGPGYGRHHMGWGGGGPADCPRWNNDADDTQGGRGYGRGYGAQRGMDEEQVKAFQEKREAFHDDTADLRQEIYQKRLEMQSEMAKKDPDADTLSKLQKEISDLKATFDQKRLAHHLEMKKAFPDAEFGGGRGHGKGYGRGYGSGMMGQGYGRGMMGGQGDGSGNCWRQ
jgi:hypothetical protein